MRAGRTETGGIFLTGIKIFQAKEKALPEQGGAADDRITFP